MKFDLHPFQDHAIEMLRASLSAGKRRPMMQAPTGAGKTLIASAIIERALEKRNSVIFTVPFLGLIDQTVERFAEQGIHRVGVMQGYHPQTDASQPIQIASVQTLMRRTMPKAKLVMVDEAHRWFDFYGTWMAMPAWQNVPFVGLSATPWTKGLGKHYDDLLIPTTTKQLIREKFLSPFKVYAPSHPDLKGVKTVAGDYHEGQLSERMQQPTLIADTVATWLKLGEDRPTLCFAVDRAHARRLADEFEAAGVPTGYVDMDTPRDERQRIGQRLAAGQIKVVVNVFTLTTGIDWDIRCIILARPTKSEILYTQIIGRGLRIAEGKTDCLILDHSDTTLRLGFVDDIHHTRLDDGKHQKGTGRDEERAPPLPKECPSCSVLKPAGVRTCPNCGFTPERQSFIEERSGELIQIKGGKKKKGDATPHTRQQVYSMLLWIQQQREYKSGFAKAKFKDRYGDWPDGLVDWPLEPDAPFLNWLKSRQIAFAKRKQKEQKEQKQGGASQCGVNP